MQLFALSLGVGNRKQDVDEEEKLPPTSCGSIVRCHQSVMPGKHLCIQLPESALFGPRHRTGRAQHLGHRGRHHTGHPESLIALQREQQDGRLQLPYLYERLKSGKRSLCTGSRRECRDCRAVAGRGIGLTCFAGFRGWRDPYRTVYMSCAYKD